MWGFIKVWVTPGTLPFLTLLVVTGLALVCFRSTRRWGLAWLGTTTVVYLILSLPWTAHSLARSLQGPFEPLVATDKVRQPVSIVVLGGDHGGGRFSETLRLYHELRPRWVILSGAANMRAPLVAAGVPNDLIIVENASRTTREQALQVAAILSAHATRDFVLVASAIQMPRAVAAVRSAGLRPVPSASRVPLHWTTDAESLVPHRGALILSAEVLYEYMALAYYRLRGWLD